MKNRLFCKLGALLATVALFAATTAEAVPYLCTNVVRFPNIPGLTVKIVSYSPLNIITLPPGTRSYANVKPGEEVWMIYTNCPGSAGTPSGEIGKTGDYNFNDNSPITFPTFPSNFPEAHYQFGTPTCPLLSKPTQPVSIVSTRGACGIDPRIIIISPDNLEYKADDIDLTMQNMITEYIEAGRVDEAAKMQKDLDSYRDQKFGELVREVMTQKEK